MIKKQFLKSKSVCKVTFTLPKEAAVNATEVKVLGDFNGWQWEEGVPMTTTPEAYTAVVELEAGRDYQFRYLIDQNRWENDWQADAYVRNVFGGSNSVIVVPSVEGVLVTNTVKEVVAKKKAVAKKEVVAPVKKKAVAKKAVVTPVKKKAVAKKEGTKKATKVKANDFKKIEGIGPKIMSVLKAAGVDSYEVLAKKSVEELRTILVMANKRYKMHDPTTWSKQADMAAKGEWDALKKWQDELKGGKAVK